MLKALELNFPSKPVITQSSKDFIKNCLEVHPENRFSVEQAYQHIMS